jgi:hypothetical protein
MEKLMRYSPRPATIVGSGSNPRPYTVYAKQDEARASERVDELSMGELSVLLAGGGWSVRCSPSKGSGRHGRTSKIDEVRLSSCKS